MKYTYATWHWPTTAAKTEGWFITPNKDNSAYCLCRPDNISHAGTPQSQERGAKQASTKDKKRGLRPRWEEKAALRAAALIMCLASGQVQTMFPAFSKLSATRKARASWGKDRTVDRGCGWGLDKGTERARRKTLSKLQFSFSYTPSPSPRGQKQSTVIFSTIQSLEPSNFFLVMCPQWTNINFIINKNKSLPGK